MKTNHARMLGLFLELLLLTTAYSFHHTLCHLGSHSLRRTFINKNYDFECNRIVVVGGRIGVVGSTTLEAKTKKKKKKGSPASTMGGGFGKTSSVPKTKSGDIDSNGDYDIFPPPPEGVKETLVPSENKDVVGDLSQEIYDRLAQIYGFDNFNYLQEEEEVENSPPPPPTSFDELLGNADGGSRGVSSDLSSLLERPAPSPAGGDMFADLIASATGDIDTSTASTTEAIKTDGEKLEFLKNLPPFTKFRVLYVDPMVLAIDDFFTDEECDRYMELSTTGKMNENDDAPQRTRSKTVGKDKLARSQRTSTTWFHNFKAVPELMAKASRLLGLEGIDRWEEPQTVRYQQSEKFGWHLDALGPTQSEKSMGGQRIATLLVYLTEIGENVGGSTAFRDLGSGKPSENDDGKYLKMAPKKGSALVFFPTAGGIPGTPIDTRTLHAGEALGHGAKNDKWIAQLWLREFSGYTPNAPPGNVHRDAVDVLKEYCCK